MILPDIEKIQIEGEKTLNQILKFSKRTGIDPTCIEDTSPIDAHSEHAQNQTLLERLAKQIQKTGKISREAWENILPKNRTEETQYTLKLALDMGANFITSGKIQSTGNLGESLSKWGARIAVSLKLDDDFGLSTPQSQKEVPKILAEAKKVAEKEGILGAGLNTIAPKGNYQRNLELQNIANAIETTLSRLEKPAQALKSWVGEKLERAFGSKEAIPEEIRQAGKWLENLPLAGKVALTAIPATLAPGALIGVPTILLAGLVLEKIQERVKTLPNPKEGEKRIAALEQEHGRRFDQDQPFWKEKIQKELQDAGLSIPKIPTPTGVANPKILIVGENHDETLENIEFYENLLPALAKQGFKTLSIEMPEDSPDLQTLQKISQETQHISNQELPLHTATTWGFAYCLAKRLNMEVILSDLPSQKRHENLTTFLRSENELRSSGNSADFNPKKVTSLWGGPQGYIQSRKNTASYVRARDLHQAQNIQKASQKGGVVHIGGSAHNPYLQQILEARTGKSPINLKIHYRSLEEKPKEHKKTHTYNIPAENISTWIKNALSTKEKTNPTGITR